jgi:excinuclease ABC subunit B
VYERDYVTVPKQEDERQRFKTQAELDAFLTSLEKEMKAAAGNLEFERAAALRDRLKRPQESRACRAEVRLTWAADCQRP